MVPDWLRKASMQRFRMVKHFAGVTFLDSLDRLKLRQQFCYGSISIVIGRRDFQSSQSNECVERKRSSY
jgi:hypothetical protein